MLEKATSPQMNYSFWRRSSSGSARAIFTFLHERWNNIIRQNRSTGELN